jgi:hypothetical protein
MRRNGLRFLLGATALMGAALVSACATDPAPASASLVSWSTDDDRGQHATYATSWHTLAEHPDARMLFAARVWSSRFGPVSSACGSFTVTFFSADGRLQIESASACTDQSGWATISVAPPLDQSGRVVQVPWSASGVISGIALAPLQGTAGL